MQRKALVDPVKTSRLRRSRGYSFEYDLVQKFKATENWDARRLGGSSTGLPDVVATNNYKGIFMVIECKSGDTDILRVPDDQVQRCYDTANLFGFYNFKYIVFAFKFKKNKEKGRDKLEYRYLPVKPSHFTKLTGLYYNIKKESGWFWYERDNTKAGDGNYYRALKSLDELISKAMTTSAILSGSTSQGRI